MGEGRLGKWRTPYWPEQRVTPGAGKKSCLPPSTYTNPDPVPRTPGQKGGTAAWGHNLSGNWQQRWEQEGGGSVPPREAMGCRAGGGRRASCCPPPARAGLCEVTASREEEGGGGGRGPGCLALVGQRDDET